MGKRSFRFTSAKQHLLREELRKKGLGAAVDRIAPRSDHGSFPLSFGQRRLWLLDQLATGREAYNIFVAVRLEGRLDRGALGRSFDEIRRRHEVLRAHFPGVGGEPVQVIAPLESRPLPGIDLTALSPARRRAESRDLARREALTPFDLSTGPLLRLRLLYLGADRHLLLVALHHIVADGWSAEVLVRELSALYPALAADPPAPSLLPEPELQYADFAAWQCERLRGERLSALVERWSRRLEGARTVLELPADRPRPAVPSLRGDSVAVRLPGSSHQELERLGQEHGATLFMVLLAAFNTLLFRHTGQRDQLVGSPIAGRGRPELEDLLGFFVNTLVLRTELEPLAPFSELLERVRSTTLAAYEDQEMPFERLVEHVAEERTLSHAPLIQVAFALQNVPRGKLELPGLEIRLAEFPSTTSKFDLSFVLRPEGEELAGLLEYRTELFDRTTVERFARHFRRLVESLTATPEQALAGLGVLAPAERAQLETEWNDAETGGERGRRSIHHLFERQAELRPGAVAVAFEERELTYGELDGRANQLAHLLRERLAVGSRVGVCLERSPELVIGLLAVLKAGMTYVPLEPAWPAERQRYILGSLEISCLLSDDRQRPRVHDLQGRLDGLNEVVLMDVDDPSPRAECIAEEEVRLLWDHVAETATGRVSAGGFVSSYTGEPMSEAEIDEYRDRVVGLAEPWLGPGSRVLEIGCGAGLILFEIAPRVERAVGLDPSPRTQEHNHERVARAELDNVELVTGFAHELDAFEEGSFDLVILASVVQFMPGPVYLREVLERALGLVAPGGAVLIADVPDARRKEEFLSSLDAYRAAHGGERTKSRLDELYFDADYFHDLRASLPQLAGVRILAREEGFTNELGFRNDVLLEKSRDRERHELPAPRRRLWTRHHLASRPRSAPAVRGPAPSLAYVIFTSGSTGTPKGVMVRHEPVVELIEWVNTTFSVGPADRLLFVTSPCFDLSVYDVFGVLAAGGSIRLASEEDLAEPSRLAELLSGGDGITFWDSAPAALQQLVAFLPRGEGAGGPALRLVFLSGDWIPVRLPDHLRRTFPRARVVALGGATEATVWSNFYPVGRIDPRWPSIPYGRPLPHARYLILDTFLESCPIGVAGDLFIGGGCLSAGYANAPATTAWKYVPDLGRDAFGARLYRTGDRARLWADGTLEFLGRADHQVKIRGFRIELGEIESVLSSHPAVADAVVLAREDHPSPVPLRGNPGDRRLVAYVVATGAAPEAAELRGYLSRQLPAHMVPSALVFLDALPQTPNGKLDRAALPAPETGAGRAGRVAPRTPVEELLAGVWLEALGLDEVGIYDNFFELGGQSLSATRCVSRLSDLVRVPLSLRDFFESPTIAQLAARLAGRLGEAAGQAPPLEPLPRGAEPELSFAQQRLWFLDQLEPGSPLYNIPFVADAAGRLEPTLLAAALGEVARRHEALRTTFVARGGRPVQAVSPEPAVALDIVDLEAVPAERRPAEAERLSRRESRRSFDLARGPLMRAFLIRSGATEHRLFLNLHHVIADGWSMGVLVRELTQLYRAGVARRPSPLPELAIQYADYAAWQRRWLSGEVLTSQLAYWRDRLAGHPALELPTDRPRPPVETFRGTQRPMSLSAPLHEAAAALGRTEGTTLYMTLLAVFKTLLFAWSGQRDVAVGSPVANRGRPETEGLIGFFANTLVMRTGLGRRLAFRDLLARVRETALGAYTHQDVPFEKLVVELQPERDMSRNPLFQVMLVLQNAPWPDLGMPGLTLKPRGIDTATAKFDVLLFFWEAEEGRLDGALEYSTELFDATTMGRFCRHFETLLSGAAAHPERRLGELSLWSAAERHQLETEWNATGSAPRREYPVHVWVEKRAATDPGAPALVCGELEITYGELNARANRLAHYLRRHGVGPDVLVGICTERSWPMVVALLAVLKAGGAGVALDPAYPEERLTFVVRDAALPVLLTQRGLLPDLPDVGIHRVFLDEWESFDAESEADPAVSVHLDNPIYGIYTSGSTGLPKGILVTHRAFLNLLEWQLEDSPLEGAARTVQFATFGFCVSFQEIFSSLCAGGVLVLLPEAARRDVEALWRFVDTAGVERLHLPFAALKQLAEVSVHEDRPPGRLREVITAGEQLQVSEAVQALFERLDGCSLHNQYGASETHVVSSYTLPGAPSGWPAIAPVGRPVANVTIHLLDEDLRPVPIGVRGELHAGGACLPRGYLNAPALSAGKLIPDPFSAAAGARLYRTGDLARHLADGRIEYFGRIDGQVKVRGFRVELGEVETVLRRAPGVRDAAVVAHPAPGAGARLAAFVVARSGPGAAPGAKQLREFLKEKLPEYMVPAVYVPMETLPLNANGKLDREALPVPEGLAEQDRPAYVAPRNPAEQVLAEIWTRVLGVERVGAFDHFFDLGGHSLLATQVVARVRQEFETEVPLRTLFEAPTLASLAVAVEARRHGAGRREPALLPAAPSGDHSLSTAQERLWFLAQLEPEGSTYNMPMVVRLTGELDVGLLARSLTTVTQRHESLRTVFPMVRGRPAARVEPPSPAPLPTIDLGGLRPGTRERECGRRRALEALRPFDLEKGPLLRATLFHLAQQEAVLVVNLHHIITDGWSMSVLVRELAAVYAALRSGERPVLPELPIRYADFAAWQREWLQSGVMEEQLEYWRGQLAGELVPLDLPTDRPRPAIQTYRSESLGTRLPPALREPLKALGRRCRSTPFMTLLAAFEVLVHRLSGQDDIRVGTPVAGRSRPELEGLVGLFLNTLAVRTDLAGNPSFTELLARVRAAALGAYDHQDVPFEQVLEMLRAPRDTSRTPVFQLFFNMLNLPEATLAADLEVEPLELPEIGAKFDMTLYAAEVEEGVELRLVYNADLFDAARIAELLRQYELLLEQAAERPEEGIESYSLVTAAARELLADPAAELTPPPYEFVGRRFLDVARKWPEEPAVIDGDRVRSYAELRRRASSFAAVLAEELGPGAPVAVCGQRSAELVEAILGVVLAGCVLVNLDRHLPAERLRTMLREAGVRRLVYVGERRPEDAWMWAEEKLEAVTLPVGDEAAPAGRGSAARLPEPGGDDPAYVFFTSGTTNTPKGVLGRQRGLSHFLAWQRETFGVGPGDRVAQMTGLSFDVVLRELFLPLTSGAALCLPPGDELSAAALFPWFESSGVTVLHTVPSLTEAWLRHLPAERQLTAMRYVFFAGEPLSDDLVRRTRRVLAPADGIVNLYGPTETTLAKCFYRIPEEPPPGVQPVGEALPQAQALVLGAAGRPCGVSEPGEIVVRTPLASLGYLSAPEQGTGRFRPNPFRDDPWDLLYFTGDRGRYRPDGLLTILGRLDDQVKVRGMRVEPAEIVAAIRRRLPVAQCEVLLREDDPGDPCLVAYVVPAPGSGEWNWSAARRRLAEVLPEYMVPSASVVLDELPLTANGKVDRRALPAPDHVRPDLEKAYEAPRTELERAVAEIWCEILHLDRVGIDDPFFEVGGHSLRLAEVRAQVAERLGIEVPMVELMKRSTVRSLARYLSHQQPDQSSASRVDRRRGSMEVGKQRRRQRLAQRRRPSEERAEAQAPSEEPKNV